MADDTPGVHHDEENLGELEVTNLRPRSVSGVPDSGILTSRLRLSTRAWQRLAIAISLVALVAILLGSQSAIRDPLQQMINAALFPTPTPTATPQPTATPLIPVLATPVAPFAMATRLPGVTGVPALDTAPAQCGGKSAMVPSDGPPWGTKAIGHAPVRLGGFVGTYPTLRLGPEAAAKAYSWRAPYTQYGWPAPIGLVLDSDFTGPVTLTGYDPRTGYPLWFGFIVAGNWGAPEKITPAYVLDPANPPVPAGGATSTEQFWYGYIFLPGAGCYIISASWPGGGWQALVSAGR